ncbi:MAG TPA: VWA domain-containing protein [Planctomycetes bacterium]|nr:VWA domain-containing protein [Planctomycetota bacterium]
MSRILLSVTLLTTAILLADEVSSMIVPLENPPARPFPLSLADEEKLRSLPPRLAGDTLFLALIAIDEVGEMPSPRAIVALADVLESNPHRWLLLAALTGLHPRTDQDLVRYGGTRLLGRLATLGSHRCRAISRRAHAIHSRIAKAMLNVDSGEQTPPNPPPSAEKGSLSPRGGTAVIGGGRGRHGGTSAARISQQLSAGIDLVWAFDVTGSMEPHLPEAIEAIRGLEKVLTPLLGKVRWGCVAYRDQVDGFRPLSSDWRGFNSILEILVARNGGGPNERVDRALSKALSSEMRWDRKRNAAIIFIADAAPKLNHGRNLPKQLAKLCKKRENLRVHAARFGLATRPGLTEKFWHQLAAAGGGRCIDFNRIYRPEVRLLEVILTSVFPQGERQQIERIVSIITAVEGQRG